MTPVSVQAFAEQAVPARALAAALAVPCETVALHHFPDGELMPRVGDASATVIAYCSLDHPNAKLIALLLAADAWRRAGASRLVLVAPYLCYLRQDTVFQPGQPLSRDVICGLLGGAFDRLVTVDAHLHRTHNLSAALDGIEAEDISAAGPLAQAFADLERPVVMGPDVESEPWVRRIAERLDAQGHDAKRAGAEVLMFRKTRRGDASVSLQAPDLTSVRGRAVLLVDDICSSGATLTGAARLVHAAGAASIDVGVVHALFGAEAEARLRTVGVRRIVSTNSVRHSSNQAPLAEVLAKALRDEVQP